MNIGTYKRGLPNKVKEDIGYVRIYDGVQGHGCDMYYACSHSPIKVCTKGVYFK
jgi:hypothetical protein